MKKMFYDVASELDEYKGLQSPTEDQIHLILEYLNHDEYSRYFFTNLENPVWVMILFKNGYFSNVPPPLEDNDNPGFYSMPAWNAGEYLKRMADKFPDIIKNVALSIDTENSRALQILLEALLKIPANITAKTVFVFKKWSETRFANFMLLVIQMGIIQEYLAKNGEVEAALEVLAVLLEPSKTKDRLDEEKILAGTRLDLYWLNKACQDNLPTLTEIDPMEVAHVAERQLIKALDLEHDPRFDENDKKLYSFWRLNISPKSELNYEGDFKNLLVNINISALSKAFEQNKDEAPLIIYHYIDSDYAIFRRVAAYILRSWGNKYRELLERVCLRQLKEPLAAGQSEFQRLLELQFDNLTDSTKEKIIATIIDETDPAWVDNILKKHPGDFYGEAGIEEKQTQKEYRQLTRLDSIADHLEGENKKFYDKLLEKYKKPSPIPEEGVIVTSWEGPESPIKLEELSKKSINEVVQDLINYLPLSKDTFGTHSREGLGRILEEDVQNRASDYADNALLFINENMHFVYYTHFFRGLEAAVKNQMRFTLTNVITIFEYITNQESDEFEKQEDEEGLPVAQLAVASLLGELLRIKDPGIGENLLERIGKIIIDLFAKKDPFLGNETDSGFDPAMRSLNSIHGMSMHCIVLYGLYSERKRKKDKGGEGEPVMVPLVKEILTEKLDKTKYPSQAIHSVFGWYFTQFIYLDKEWALENRERIFPTEPEMAKYWQAAWGAYLQFSDIYTNVFPALIKQYRKALEELSTIGRNKNLQRLDEKIATHILKAYLLDMIKMDSEDCLILSYYKNANDETRSYGNFWLSQAMDAQKPSIHDARWVRIWNLWQWRIKEAITSENRSNYVKEISNFCRLLKYAPVDLSEMYPILKQTLGFVSKSYEVGLIINYLGENSEKYPNLAISLLHEIILSGQSIYLIEDSKNSIRKIIISIPYSDLESRAKAIEIINVFGERGDYEWRSLLIGLSE